MGPIRLREFFAWVRSAATAFSKFSRREMRAIARQADSVNSKRAFTLLASQDENRHPVRLLGRKELNQRAVATVRKSLGEAPTAG